MNEELVNVRILRVIVSRGVGIRLEYCFRLDLMQKSKNKTGRREEEGGQLE